MRARVSINIPKIKKNAEIIINKCSAFGIEAAAVTKMHCADIAISKALTESGIKILADSRIENIKKLSGINCEKWLLRIPAPSILEETVEYCDVSLNSELSVIEELSRIAQRLGKIHKVILMFDLGDLREGYFYQNDILSAALKVSRMKNILLYGVGTNLSCYGGIMPTVENMTRLLEVSEIIEENTGQKLKYISGGSSTSYTLLLDGTMPRGINNLRIGDTFYFGRDMSRRTYIEGMEHDCMVLTCEIAEIKTKPSVPIGKQGFASLNRKPVFEDKGLRKRAILSIGRQDTDLDLIPKDKNITVMEASSDHLLVDVTQSEIDYKVGDCISFDMLYTSCLRSFTSPYVDKEYIL